MSAIGGLVRAPRRLLRGVVKFVRFMAAALRLFDGAIPRFRTKTALVIAMEFVAALAAGLSWTVLVPFLQHLTGGSTAGLPDDAFGRLYRFFGERLSLVSVSAIVFAAVLAKNVLSVTATTVQLRMSADLAHRLRTKIFTAYIESDLKFFEQAQDGRFLNVFNQEMQRTEKILRIWRRAVSSTLTALVYLVLLFMISTTVTALLLLGGVVLLLGLMRFYYRLRENGYQVTRMMERLNNRIAEMIRCFVLIKSVGSEAHERQEFERASRRYAEAESSQNFLSLFPGALIEVAAYALLLFVVSYVHLVYVAAGQLNPFVIVSYLIFASKFVDATTVVSGTVSQLLQDASGFESTHRALAVRPVQEIRFGTRTIGRGPQPILVEDVSFAHAGQVVLDRCRFSVGAGEFVAVVGTSGAGKSTLALLLAGLYRPQSGTVWIGEAPLEHYSRDALVDLIGYQAQDPRLVEGSIADNLVYGLRTPATPDTLEAVLRRAHLHDLLDKKEERLQSGVGERGGAVSGGERQRVALGRILLRDPGILILDEITSALDVATERVVLDALAAVKGSKTIVLITHRLRSATIADRILVLDGGRIVEEGSFDDLHERNGVFAQLSHSQAGMRA